MSAIQGCARTATEDQDNSPDSIGDDETAWGNPPITKAMVDATAKRGFKTLRIPVT